MIFFRKTVLSSREKKSSWFVFVSKKNFSLSRMASVSAPPFPSPSTHSFTDSSNPRNFSFRNPKFPVSSSLYSPPLKKSSSSSSHSSAFSSTTRVSESTRCRCQNRSDLPSTPDNDETNLRWDSSFQDIVKNVIKRFDDYMNSIRIASRETENLVVEEKDEGEEWDWDRWKKHFEDVEEQEKIVSVLKSQLRDAVHREDYEDAAKLKVALAAVATNDTVGRVINSLNRAIQEERYQDAAFVRDSAAAGLVGWWAGISKDSDQPYGRIIRISAEHGRYVARSYSPRHLATSAPGLPVFEVFLTSSSEGEYKQQAVYLKRVGGKSGDSPKRSSWLIDPSSFDSRNESNLGENDFVITSMDDMGESGDRDDDSDVVEGVTRFPNILRDMIPGVKVTVLKVTAPGKVDRDLISKVIEQIMEEEEEEDGEEDEVEVEVEEEDDEEEEEEDEDKDVELESVDISVEVTDENIQDKDEIVMDVGGLSDTTEEQSEMAMKFALSGLAENLFSGVSSKSSLIRVPAKIEKTGRLSFSFSIDKDESEEAGAEREKGSPGKSANRGAQLSIDHLMTDLAKSAATKEKLPMKVLKDVGEFINLSLSQAQNRQLLSGTTNFNRIEIPSSSDLLNGLYIGTHGLHSSEVIHIRRKFGQWNEDGVTDNLSNLEFYEYVEALKLIGDSYVPAGQVAFRAKVGKQYQLPHKGIIPEEFGLVARYKGQGRIADPGFKNPRWVDGELVILDGKYIKGGPVVGFVYWAPEYHFLVFFHRLSLQE